LAAVFRQAVSGPVIQVKAQNSMSALHCSVAIFLQVFRQFCSRFVNTAFPTLTPPLYFLPSTDPISPHSLMAGLQGFASHAHVGGILARG